MEGYLWARCTLRCSSIGVSGPAVKTASLSFPVVSPEPTGGPSPGLPMARWPHFIPPASRFHFVRLDLWILVPSRAVSAPIRIAYIPAPLLSYAKAHALCAEVATNPFLARTQHQRTVILSRLRPTYWLKKLTTGLNQSPLPIATIHLFPVSF